MYRGKPPEKAPDKVCSRKNKRGWALQGEELKLGGGREGGKGWSSARVCRSGDLQGWPSCFEGLVVLQRELEVEKLNGAGACRIFVCRGRRGVL